MKQTLKTFQKRLVNVSARNKSLFLPRLSKGQFIDLHDLDFLNNKPSFSLIEQLLGKGQPMQVAQVVDSRHEKNNQVSALLRAISRTEAFIFEEQGSLDLYVGYPFVEGKMIDDAPVRCPLLFIPVRLYTENNGWWIGARPGVEITFNKTLLLAFSHYNHLTIDEKLLEFDFEEFPSEAQEFLTALYRLLEDSPIELNFNPEMFERVLHNFQIYKREEFDRKFETGRLRLASNAVLGIFPQTDSYLMPDYEVLLQDERINEVEDLFGIPEDQADGQKPSARRFKEEELIAPYPADSSQENVLKMAKAGQSLVIQGPPGSGKSQLICNLIADYLARGKNVLVVCQKRAALDVVYERLKEQSLNDFVALVHDFRNDRREIYDKINRQIEQVNRYAQLNNSLDAIHLERSFVQHSREIDQHADQLEQLREALYDSQDFGVPVHELYLNSNPQAATILSLRTEYEAFNWSSLPAFRNKVQLYVRYALSIEHEAHPWAVRNSFAAYQFADLPVLSENISKILPTFKAISEEVENLIGVPVELDECLWLHERESDFRKLMELLSEPAAFRYFKKLLAYPEASSLWLTNARNNLLNCFGAEGVETTLRTEELPSAHQRVHNAHRAMLSWYDRMKWNMFSKDKKPVEALLRANGLEPAPEQFEVLMRRIDNRMNFEHNRTKLLSAPWLTEMPEGFRVEEYRTWSEHYLMALEAKSIYTSLRNGIRYLALETLSFDEFFKKINQMLLVVSRVPALKATWLQWLHLRQLNALLNGSIPAENLLATLRQDFDDLCAFDRLKQELTSAEQTIIGKLAEHPWHETHTWELFANSLYIQWIQHIETKHPVLRMVSTKDLEKQEELLQRSIEEKQPLCRDILLMKMRERTFSELEYNRLNNLVTYRDLKHQVSKKRNIWPMRKLIHQFAQELFNLMPCWMGSPEAISAIFPMEKLFDLVIFDEASQCFAEKGLPAIYRGRQSIITGDSQQLAPFDLYQPRWEEDADDDPALEITSLLDMGARYLPQQRLQGHYRSRSLELIQFSNHHFYEGKLQLIPHFTDFNRQEAAIRYLHTPEGVWEQNTNRREAEKVVELVRQYLQQGRENIGVITFNFAQQGLILDLLDETGLNLPPTLFVKNIENVQGDERDIIIFSIGYARTPEGRLRLNFGSLSMAGGENRLNVAVTRAREQVVVVCSLLPSELNTEGTKNAGPALLQAYLHYAYKVSEGSLRSGALPVAAVAPAKAQHGISTLSDRLRQLPAIQPALGEPLPFADLTVQANNQVAGLILCDDQLYMNSLTAKDAHGYTPILLRRKNWPWNRFYSRNFWKDRALFEEGARKYVLQQVERG